MRVQGPASLSALDSSDELAVSPLAAPWVEVTSGSPFDHTFVRARTAARSRRADSVKATAGNPEPLGHRAAELEE
jgi:hypothetical protein